MRNSRLYLLLIVFFLLQACLPTMQIEQLGIINSRGVDLIEEGDDKIVETTIIPYLFDPSTDEITTTLVGRAHTIKQARQEAAKQTSFELTPGQIRLEVYGKEAAEVGILSFLNTLVRDARVSDSMQLAVTNQTAREILESEQTAIKINTAQYLQDLLTKEKKHNTLPNNSLHAFTRSVEEVGIDPILPIIDVIADLPTIAGTALFQGDKYVGNVPFHDGFLINILQNRLRGAPLEVAIPYENYQEEITKNLNGELSSDEEHIYLALWLTRGRGRLKLEDRDQLHYKATIKMTAELLETSIPMEVRTQEIAEKLEKDIEQYYVSQFETLFAKMQEVNADSFGLGQVYKATREGSRLTRDEWMEKFPETALEFDVDFTILDFGTID
jgi:spore germination protein